MTEDGGDEIRALWKMAVHGPETDPGLGGDLPHRRVHSGSREHRHRRLQQRVHVPLSIGSHVPMRAASSFDTITRLSRLNAHDVSV